MPAVLYFGRCLLHSLIKLFLDQDNILSPHSEAASATLRQHQPWSTAVAGAGAASSFQIGLALELAACQV